MTPRPSKARAGGYRRLLRWAGLPITNRRWAAPLSAIALGFGLFVGVAIGPGASGTLATNAAQVIEIPGFSGGAEEVADDRGEPGGSSAIASSPPPSPQPESSFAEPAPIESFAPETPAPTEPPGPDAGSAPQPEEDEGSEATEPQSIAGVVVHVNPAAGSYTLAEAGGTLSAVHAAEAPVPGAKVKVPVRLLANGTFAQAGEPVRSGSRRRAAFNGIVTYLDPTPAAPAYAVSKRGVSLLVHVRPDPTGVPPVMPALGAFASVTVDIERPPVPVEPPPTEPAAEPAPVAPVACAPDPAQPLPAIVPEAVLWQHEASADGAPFTYADLAGIVTAICPETGQLAISSDDIREGLHDVVLTVPAAIDVRKLKIGESVTATATFGDDGSLALSGLASDERSKGADDFEATQGDLAVEEPPK